MKIAIVQFPGSNCERETILAIKRAGMMPVEFLWNESQSKLAEMDGYVIVGGFSYEDRSRAGIIAALDPVMSEIKRQSEQGKPVLGICNGAQILVETGLVPGLKDNQLGMALTENRRIANGKILGTGFYNAWINMRPCSVLTRNAFTRHLTNESILRVPIAHAEGRFVMSDALLAEIEQEGLNVFQYCDEQGRIVNDFPINPNGSMCNMAAVMNKAGNVMAMMPHPERTPIGDALFLSMRDYIADRDHKQPESLDYMPVPVDLPVYRSKQSGHEFLVKMVITDNHALTMQNTLNQLGLSVRVSRMVHWQIECDSSDLIEQIKTTGLLFNDRKEYLVESLTLKSSQVAYLVRPQDNLLGQQKQQLLEDHFAVDGLHAIHYGVVWLFETTTMPLNELQQALLKTNIFFNPYAHECFIYE